MLLACQLTYSQSYKVKEKKGKSALFYGKENITGYVYDAFKAMRGETYGVKNESGWGLIHQSGETIIECKYDTLMSSGKKKFIVELDGKYGMISETAETILEPIYDKIDHHTDAESLLKLDGQWTLKKGNIVSQNWEDFVFYAPEQAPLYGTCSPEEIKDGKTDEECSQLQMLMSLYQKLKYPAIARENGVEGTIVIRFIITAQGQMKDAEIIRNVGAGCGKEALRVVTKHLGNWTPAKQDGINVASRFNLPVKFKLR